MHLPASVGIQPTDLRFRWTSKGLAWLGGGFKCLVKPPPGCRGNVWVFVQSQRGFFKYLNLFFTPTHWGFMIQFDLRKFFKWVGSSTNYRESENWNISMDVSKNRGTPKWMVKIMENPIKMDDLGGNPLFSETSLSLRKSWRRMMWFQFDGVKRPARWTGTRFTAESGGSLKCWQPITFKELWLWRVSYLFSTCHIEIVLSYIDKIIQNLFCLLVFLKRQQFFFRDWFIFFCTR